MINFSYVKWKNFLSTGNVFTTIPLNKNKTTLIVGENGAGKSTILDALTFVLFGKSFRKINKPQLVNSINNKGLLVEVEFVTSNKTYKVIRGIKPNVFEIYKDGELLNQSADAKDYQEILEKQILKINYKSFCQVVVLGSATYLPFMQLPAAQRREIIENLLDLQIFTTMNSLLKDKVSKNKDAIKECESNKNLIEQKIQLSEEYLKKVENNIEKTESSRKKILEDIEQKIKSVKKDYDKSLKILNKQKSKFEDEDKYNKKYASLNNLKIKIENNISNIENEISFFHKNDNCPTCNQTIDNKFKNVSIEEKQKQVEEMKDGLNKMEESFTEVNKKLKEFSVIKVEYNKNLINIQMLMSETNSLNKNKELILNQIEEDNTQEALEESTKIVEYRKQLEEIQKQYYELLEERTILNASSVLLKDGGIKTRIIKKYIPIINKNINRYLSALNFFVKFELDEEFNEVIKSRHRDEFSYSSFSEGERMKINLAILFTWRMISKLRNSINTNILIMDEVFDSSLDSNATDDFMKLINEQDNNSNVIIISHKTEQLNDKFENVITFKKIKNFSKVTK